MEHNPLYTRVCIGPGFFLCPAQGNTTQHKRPVSLNPEPRAPWYAMLSMPSDGVTIGLCGLNYSVRVWQNEKEEMPSERKNCLILSTELENPQKNYSTAKAEGSVFCPSGCLLSLCRSHQGHCLCTCISSPQSNSYLI